MSCGDTAEPISAKINQSIKKTTMGAWGFKTFENDDAGDWAYELEESDDFSAIEAALSPGELDYLEAPDGSLILAASEVLIALKGTSREGIPDAVSRWIAAHRGRDSSHLAVRALPMLQRVLAPSSELRELWAENEDLFPLWKADVEDLIAKLKG